jgi:methionyl-tRNA formyltransferase
MELEMKLGLLVSGDLGSDMLIKLAESYILVFVMTDKKSSRVLEFCAEKQLPIYMGNPRNGRAVSFYKQFNIDVLVSVNYLFLIEQDLISFPRKLAFNVHGSLLPKYRGRTPHVWAIINNEKETGITAHVIDKGCDTGDILLQKKIRIDDNDTGGAVLGKFKEMYYGLINEVLTNVSKDSLKAVKQDETKATYFGKRSENDGKINWNWQKLRIKNWIRAQASPYPGAFTFCGKQKLIIDKIEFDDFGFIDEMPNGMILSLNPFLVKTPNGVIRILEWRNKNINLLIGQTLN